MRMLFIEDLHYRVSKAPNKGILFLKTSHEVDIIFANPS